MRSKRFPRTLSERHSDLGHPPARDVERRVIPLPLAERCASPALTPRQRDVLALLIGTGLSCKQIAAELELCEGTIRTHMERIYRAFGVHSRPELTVALLAPPSPLQQAS